MCYRFFLRGGKMMITKVDAKDLWGKDIIHTLFLIKVINAPFSP
jgi:hypothetical protein